MDFFGKAMQNRSKFIIIKAMVHRALSMLQKDADRYLREVSGVIHVGANVGQERELYAKHDLPVIWVEPIPEIFETLQANLTGFAKQRAINCLVTDQNGAEYEFHIASNNGASSSILEFNLHKDIWPHVAYEKTIKLRSKTLASLLDDEDIDSAVYDALVIDTQGTELLVLQGVVPILQDFTYIKLEVADFEAYTGCCQLDDITAFLASHGYRECYRHKFKARRNVGNCYDVVYKREV